MMISNWKKLRSPKYISAVRVSMTEYYVHRETISRLSCAVPLFNINVAFLFPGDLYVYIVFCWPTEQCLNIYLTFAHSEPDAWKQDLFLVSQLLYIQTTWSCRTTVEWLDRLIQTWILINLMPHTCLPALGVPWWEELHFDVFTPIREAAIQAVENKSSGPFWPLFPAAQDSFLSLRPRLIRICKCRSMESWDAAM